MILEEVNFDNTLLLHNQTLCDSDSIYYHVHHIQPLAFFCATENDTVVTYISFKPIVPVGSVASYLYSTSVIHLCSVIETQTKP